jgi:hypothetical protein
MRTHLDACADCRADEAALRTLCRELNVLPEVDPPLFFRDNVMTAIERQNAQSTPSGPWWKMLPQLSRLAVGTALTTGAAAVLVWSVMQPTRQQGANNHQASAPIASSSSLLNLLPGANADTVAKATPRLRIARVTTVDPESDGPAYDFSLWMENVSHGTARFRLVGDDAKRNYRFNLSEGSAPSTLRVPFAAVSGKDTLDLEVLWTANSETHTRQLFVPLPEEGDPLPETRQSFGLPEGNLMQVGQQIAARYGVPVTLDDVPQDLRVSVASRGETALETLQRNLSGHTNLRVSETKAGLLIEKVSSTETPAASPTPTAP